MLKNLALAGVLALACLFAVPAKASLGLSVDAASPEAMHAVWGASARLPPHDTRLRYINPHGRRYAGSMLSGVYAPLADKARAIVAACGSRVVSGVRHTRVAGSGRWSLHASGHAVDIAGNPGCIYAHLRGWPGGYSTDYGRVRHVHISLGGREDGHRFAHHRASRMRYAWAR